MYAIVTYIEAFDHIAALPPPVLLSYAEVLDVLQLAPWSGEPYNARNPDGAMRQLVFGSDGRTLVIYLILEDERRVDVLRVH